MYSYIYQIESGPCQKDERVSESDFYEHLDDIPADYVNGVTEDDEKKAIGYLSDLLPKSMFKCEGREITFLGGDEKFFDQWKKKVEKSLHGESSTDIANGRVAWSYLYKLQRVVENVLDLDIRFYSQEDGYCKKSTEFILGMTRAEPGTKVYVGAVISYHY